MMLSAHPAINFWKSLSLSGAQFIVVETNIISPTNIPNITLEQLPFFSAEVNECIWVHHDGAPKPIDPTPRNKGLNYRMIHVLQELRRESKNNYYCLSDLTLMLQLPVEIILEIFEYLHPLDLYHLSRTNKRFRALLVTVKSKPIWKASFECNPEIPTCPSDMPYPKWAELLFGRFECQDCTSLGAFALPQWRRRLCEKCVISRAIDFCDTSLSDKFPMVMSDSDSEDIDIPAWKRIHEYAQQVADTLGSQWILGPSYEATYPKVFHLGASAASLASTLREDSDSLYLWGLQHDNRHYQSKYTGAHDFLTRRLERLGFLKSDVELAVSSDAFAPCLEPLINHKHNRYLRQEWPKVKAKLLTELYKIIERRERSEQELLISHRRHAMISQPIFSGDCRMKSCQPLDTAVSINRPCI